MLFAFPQAGDSAILIEYGEMTLDFAVRARIHALEMAIKDLQVDGIQEFAPCIRSTMVCIILSYIYYSAYGQ